MSNVHRQCVQALFQLTRTSRHLTALNVGSDHAQRHAIGHFLGKGLQADLAADLWKFLHAKKAVKTKTC